VDIITAKTKVADFILRQNWKSIINILANSQDAFTLFIVIFVTFLNFKSSNQVNLY